MVGVQHSKEPGAATSTKLLMSQMINILSHSISVCEIPVSWLYGSMLILSVALKKLGRTKWGSSASKSPAECQFTCLTKDGRKSNP